MGRAGRFEATVTSEYAGVPEFFIYVNVCAGIAFSGDNGTIVILTLTDLTGMPEVLSIGIVVLLVDPIANPPQPADAWTVNVPAVVALAVPLVTFGVTHAAVADPPLAAAVSTIKGVPPFAAVTAEDTVTV